MKTITLGVLTARVFTGFEPFAFYQGDELVGFDVDTIRAFATQAKLELTLDPTDTFDGIWYRPAAGECDLALAGIACFVERMRADVSWSDPYFQVLRSILIHREHEQELRHINDFQGRSIAFVRGSCADLDTRQRARADTRLVPVENQRTGMSLLDAKAVDGLAMGAPSNAYDRQFNPDYILVDVHEFTQAEGFRFPVAASNPLLLKAVNAFINTARENGQIDTMMHRWIDDRSVL
jgi:ABC-type amino acid transport substrate-binding protein